MKSRVSSANELRKLNGDALARSRATDARSSEPRLEVRRRAGQHSRVRQAHRQSALGEAARDCGGSSSEAEAYRTEHGRGLVALEHEVGGDPRAALHQVDVGRNIADAESAKGPEGRRGSLVAIRLEPRIIS